MKKALFTSILLAITSIALAKNTDSTTIAHHDITLYGFARSEMYVNSRENIESKSGLICIYPKPIELDDYGYDKNAKVNAAFLAITSRIGVKYAYTQNHLTLGAHIEGDFCGTKDFVDVFRLRHAYASVRYKNHTWLAGQTWHPYYDGIFPNVLTLNGGTPTGIINRSPQIRYEWQATPSFKLTAAFVTEGIKYIRPEAVLGFTGTTNNWKYGLMGEYRYCGIDHTFTSEIGSTVQTMPLHSFSGTVYTEFKQDNWLFNARLLGGQNLSHLIVLGGYGLVSKDVENLQATYANLDQMAAYVCASYGKKWRFNVFAGYLKTFGADQECLQLYGAGSNVSDIIKSAVSAEFNYKGLGIGLECEYTNAAYGHWEGKKLTPDYRVGNIRGVLRVSYSFSHTWNK